MNQDDLDRLNDSIGGNSREMIRSFVDRFERLFGDLAGLQEDVAEVNKEAKGAGLDPAILRKVAKIRLKDKALKTATELDALRRYADAAGVQLDMFAKDFVPSGRDA